MEIMPFGPKSMIYIITFDDYKRLVGEKEQCFYETETLLLHDEG